VIREQHCHRGRADHATLVEGGKDRELIMAGSTKGSSVVEVNRERIVSKALESLIVVAVHVAHQEVKDGEVHQVQQTATLIIRVNVPNDITVIRIRFPLSLPPLVVAASPWVSPSFPWCDVFGGEKSSKASFQHVWAAADCVRRVAVVGALAVEAEVARWRDEESLEKISFGQRVDLSCDVQRSPGDGDGSAKAKQSVEMEGSDLSVMPLEVGEVEVVGQRLLGARKPHWLEKSLPSVLKLDYKLQLGSPLLLADPHNRETLHRCDRLRYRLLVGPVHLLLGDTKLELLPHTLRRGLTALR